MIAYVGPHLPHDLLAACGRCAGALPWNVDRAMPAADRWLESKFPVWARSIVQDWADGVLDGHEAVVFSRADDAAQRLYYYLCELRRQGAVKGPEPLNEEIESSLVRVVASVGSPTAFRLPSFGAIRRWAVFEERGRVRRADSSAEGAAK